MYIAQAIVIQLFFTLFPIIAFQFSGFGGGGTASRKQRLWIGAVCFVSMVACMRFAFPLYNFYYFDFRLIPFIVGVLYGGFGIGIVMTLLYVAVRYAMYGGGPPFESFVMQHAVLVPIIFMCVPAFRRASLMKRGKMAAWISIAVLVTTGWFAWLRSRWTNTELKPDFYVSMFVLYALMGLAAWLMIYFIECIANNRRMVAELKKLSFEREQEASKLRSLMDALPLAVVSVDTEFNVTELNDYVYLHWPEKKRTEVIGGTYRVFTDPFELDYRKTGIYRALQGEIIKNEVMRYNNRTFLVNAYPNRNVTTGEIEGAVNISLDITELHQLRTEIGKLGQLKLVGQMAASIAHEVRNPMTVVRGFLQLLSQSPGDPEKAKRYFELALEELDRANNIIADFLSLAHNRVVAKTDQSLNEIVRELEPLLQAEASLRGVTLLVELDPEVPVLKLNPKEMKQLILNLTRNAFEELGEGGKVAIRTIGGGDRAELQVQDNGRGIPEEHIDQIFEPFYTTKDTGTGLGLPACLSIVEQHGGTIRVHSKMGKGTTFIVAFERDTAAG